MRDREFLIWLHERLAYEYEVPYSIDYMGKLRSIIAATDPEAETPNTAPDLPA